MSDSEEMKKSDLDKFIDAINNAKANKGIAEGIRFSFEDVYPTSWNDFLIKTDIGHLIAKNDRVTFKNSYGDRAGGAFIKIDDDTFAKIRMLGNEDMDRCFVGVSFFSREQFMEVTQVLIDFGRPDYLKKLKDDRDTLLGFKDFETNPKDRRQELKDILNNYAKFKKTRESFVAEEYFSDQDLDIILELYLVDFETHGKRETGMIPGEIRSMPKFKEKVINYAKQNPINERISSLFVIGGVLDESNLEDKEFVENVGQKYGVYEIAALIYRDLKYKEPDVVEEKLKFAQKFLKENNDIDVIRGILANVDTELASDPKFIEKVLKITTDQKVVSDILRIARRDAYENPLFVEKILGGCKESENIKTVLSHLDNESLKNPGEVLKMIRICPNIMEVLEDDGKFYNLKYNKDFQKGLFEITRELISQSEIQEHYVEAGGSVRQGYKPAYTYYSFDPESPMGIFEGKMSQYTKDILLDINFAYFENQQKQLENPEYTTYEIYEIKSAARDPRYSLIEIASAVKKAQAIVRDKNPSVITTEKIGVIAGDNTRKGSIENTTNDIKVAEDPNRAITEQTHTDE